MTTYCPTKREIQYYDIDYGFESVKTILKDYYNLKTMCLYSTNFELVSILADFKDAILKCGLSDKQLDTIKLYMLGYTEAEIGVKLGTSQQNINKTIARVCNKIANYLNEGESE